MDRRRRRAGQLLAPRGAPRVVSSPCRTHLPRLPGLGTRLRADRVLRRPSRRGQTDERFADLPDGHWGEQFVHRYDGASAARRSWRRAAAGWSYRSGRWLPKASPRRALPDLHFDAEALLAFHAGGRVEGRGTRRSPAKRRDRSARVRTGSSVRSASRRCAGRRTSGSPPVVSFRELPGTSIRSSRASAAAARGLAFAFLFARICPAGRAARPREGAVARSPLAPARRAGAA
jgi:hypothetical protein